MAILLGDTAAVLWQRVMLMHSIKSAQQSAPRFWYETLEAYYMNNSLYDDITMELYNNAIWTPGMKALRNPVNRAVEFYVSKLWPGSLRKGLPIVTENKKLLPAVERIWEWSNWGPQKQVAARWLAGFGDLFIKVAQKKEGDEVTRVYLDPIKSTNVIEFDLDERGFLTYIRIDVPAGDLVHTEVWSKTMGSVRIWRHDQGLDKDLEDLGAPSEGYTFEQLGYDFIPIVHAKFKDIGQSRGVACFIHGIDKIDEANRQATRLHQILFRYNKPTKAVMANDKDPSGRPLPPPTVTGLLGTSSSDGEVYDGDDDLWMMPGMSKLEQMVPDIRYDAALSILNAQMEELTKDLPEVLYYELKDKENLSGVALRTMLGPAIDRVVEARGNAEPALIRAHQMALTLANIHGLLGDNNPGSFEAGDFVHTFAERDVIAKTATERAETIQAETQAGIPLITSMKRNGFEDEEIEDMMGTEEYKLFIAKNQMEVVKLATEAGMPLETALATVGWTKEQLAVLGTQRLAQITLEQEDTVPEVEQ